MQPRVLIFGSAAWAARARGALAATAAVVEDGAGAAVEPLPACVLCGPDVVDADVRRIASLFPPERRHIVLAVRPESASIDVEWTVIDEREIERSLLLVVEEAEAVTVELLARVRAVDEAPVTPVPFPRRPPGLLSSTTTTPPEPPSTLPLTTAPRFGCVVSVGSTAIICAIDDAARLVVVAFVLPGVGRIELEGVAQRLPGRPGLVRVAPRAEELRQRLREFVIRRAGDGEP